MPETPMWRCPDGGYCHHGCETTCFRVRHAGPLSGEFRGDRWPEELRGKHGALGDRFDHAELHGAIAEALADGGPVEDEIDAATAVMDVLVVRGIVPPPEGYDRSLAASG